MTVEIKVPSVGESIVEGTIARWLKKDGETVRVDEPLFELETDKATTEVPAPAAGQLAIQVPDGQTVAVGSVVGRINTDVVAKADKPTAPQKEPTRAPPAPAESKSTKTLSPAVQPLPDGPPAQADKRNDKALLPPVPAVVDAIARKAAEQPRPSDQRESRQRMSPIRQRIAERLVAAQHTAAILTTFNECDMTAVMEIRSRYKESFQKKHGVGLSFISFFVKACVEALRSFPIVNAFIDGNDVLFHDYCDIGVAVSTEKGLMVPVVRGCEHLGFAEIEKRIDELAQKARAGKISVQDLQGGTFTITNGGVFGSLLSTPILNPPQSAILGMHTIQKRPIAVNDNVVIRPMMYVALSYDHRLIDGRDAVQFLVRVKECVERPERVLLEI